MSTIAFFGTPNFAATIFKSLISYCEKNGHTIEFVVCQPDRPKGRGQSLTPPEVKTLAQENNIEVLQPTTLKAGTPDGENIRSRMTKTPLDLAIVVAYGKLIPKGILELPKRGFINVHASLLPRWRGASPIQRALQAGDSETGVCIMDLIPQMDAGDVYLKKSIPIAKEDNATTLFSKLASLGQEALTESLDGILDGSLQKTPQDGERVTFAPKLQKSDGEIDWEKEAHEIVNHERAMHGWPNSFTYHKGKMVKLFGAHTAEFEKKDVSSGTVLKLEKDLVVKCKNGSVAFTEIQLEGKKRMAIADVRNGKLLEEGDQFSTR